MVSSSLASKGKARSKKDIGGRSGSYVVGGRKLGGESADPLFHEFVHVEYLRAQSVCIPILF
jgi:hypothetical protein